MENTELVDHVFHRTPTRNAIHCHSSCVDDCRCLSFNYKENNEGNVCELNEGSHFINQTSLKSSPGSRYYNLRREFSQKNHHAKSCDGDVTCVNGCCKKNPCQNGGACAEICEPTSVRYNCSCPEKFIGRHCEFERKSCQAYKTAGETSSGLYTIIDDSNQSFQVFCDFASEPGFAWNLIQSFRLSQTQNIIFSGYTNAISDDQPNWHAYLIHPIYLVWLRTQSTHWRATCRYDTNGVVYTDYMRTSLANCDIITLPEGTPPNICFQFEFINIRGHECFNCTAPLWNSPALHTDTGLTFCELNATEGAVASEDNFGLYSSANPLHRCSSGPNSTTKFWLGGQ
ncbi:unnamed protein product [Porites evermanni]|uniref:EGF-like domain-containing protein n=1 Tax=Porites evermanni TaxID=104178 RepID=A0ABN8MM75_9CNID|nr:unnamed protein product [Porites evermanni]